MHFGAQNTVRLTTLRKHKVASTKMCQFFQTKSVILMKKVAKFSLSFFTPYVQKALNTSELGIVWIVSRENKKGMETRKLHL